MAGVIYSCVRVVVFLIPSGILPVSFRYPSGVQVKLQRDSGFSNGSFNGCLAPFRYPSGILPACG